jgi:uncharacterized protein YbbC (DUF1343 family)/CubicO group peptidase (beta-lactamase class C family)
MKQVTVLLFCLPGLLAAQERFAGSAALDEAIEKAITDDQLPGAVLWVAQPGKILHRKAYGDRALEPVREPMTLDTIFDAASLTKVVATTPSIMKLVEQGKVRLNDRVTEYLPQFQDGKSGITVRQLLTHFSGMRPDLDLKPAWSGYETGIEKALADTPIAEPGARFIYSDINFILLGEIVRVVSGKPLNEFAQENVFEPLGMTDTRFLPPEEWRERIAPTERVDGEILRGVVHDPTTRMMGGVAGHAGLFTTAHDLALYCDMLLNLGEAHGVRLFSPLTIRKFSEPNTPPHQAILRGLGFDIDSPYSANRGDLFPIGSFGHTGFTGTSIWVDPATRTYVILLANSVHPHLRPALSPLRGKVATITAAALGMDAPGMELTGYNETSLYTPVRRNVARNAEVLNGLDVLAGEKFERLRGKKIGLVTNHTGLTRDGRRNVDAMLAEGVKVTALFSPEHGLSGREDREGIANATDPSTGLPVYSLYQEKERKPQVSILRQFDALVFDIQDVGARFYTYMTTMKYAMEAAAEARISFLVLDRPNPITGLYVEGPMVDADRLSFIAPSVLPLRHGMTAGELARMMNAEDGIGAQLEVVAMKNWMRGDWWDATGLTWVDPSPNLRSLNAALLYPGIAMMEASRNLSVGRGTDAPFEQIGADWIRGQELAAFLNKRMVPGVRFYPTRFTPTASNFSGRTVEGVRMVITDREGFSALRLGLEVAFAFEKLYPGKINWETNLGLIGSRATVDAIRRGEDPRSLEPEVTGGLAPFLEKRSRYLLYR